MFCWKCEIQNPDCDRQCCLKNVYRVQKTLMYDYFSLPVSLLLDVALGFFPPFTASPALIWSFFFLPIASHILYFLTIFLSLLCCRVLSPLICCWLFLWFLFPCILLFPLYEFAHTVSTLFFLSRFFSHVYRVVSGGCGMTLWGNRSPPSSLETSTALLRSTEVTTGYLQFASSSLSPYLLY